MSCSLDRGQVIRGEYPSGLAFIHQAPRTIVDVRGPWIDGTEGGSAIECLHDLLQGRSTITVSSDLGQFRNISAFQTLHQLLLFEKNYIPTNPLPQCQFATLSQSAQMCRPDYNHMKRESDRCRKMAHDPSSRRSIQRGRRPRLQ